jgi:hypothetical protein
MALITPKGVRLYSILTINLITIVALLFVLNMMAFAAIEVKNSFFPSRSLNDLQAVYPDMESSDIPLLLEETWDRPWQYEPWVGFKEKPRAGEFVNISSEGFRHSHIKNLRLDSTGINIYVFGGSTTFGYGLDDASTIPSHLQKHLSNLHPNKIINIFNFGRGYYYSDQELVLLLQLIRNNNIPAISIFIDGLNEGQVEPYYTKEMFSMFNAYNYSQYEILMRLIENSSLMRVIRELASYVTDQPQKKEYQPPIDISKNYQRNKEIIETLAEKFNFHTYFFIQPVPGYRNELANHVFSTNSGPANWNQRGPSKMQLLEKTTDNLTSFSLAHLLDNYGQQQFVDNVHYTSRVCDLIAENIAPKILIPHQ